jgi:hypothetical protein
MGLLMRPRRDEPALERVVVELVPGRRELGAEDAERLNVIGVIFIAFRDVTQQRIETDVERLHER